MSQSFKIKDRVRHLSDAPQTGVVTAICERENGFSFGVAWSDLAERWHASGELKLDDGTKREIKIPS